MANFFTSKTVMVLTVKEECKAERKTVVHHLNNAHFELIIRHKTTGESKGKHQREPQWSTKSSFKS